MRSTKDTREVFIAPWCLEQRIVGIAITLLRSPGISADPSPILSSLMVQVIAGVRERI